jgi:steroid 5-alpha reductase family enzyme
MSYLSIFGIAGLVILGLMVILWLISLILKNSSIVDIFWGTGFVITGWVYFILTPQGLLSRKIILMILVTVWGLRLSGYILKRNFGKPEDFRYQVWRKEAGSTWWLRSFFKVFFLQGVLLWIISVPLLSAQFMGASRLTFFDYLAVPLWLIGFFFESVGDWQLARHKSNPRNKGKVLSTGVWRYTRHPNYFGDSAQWWAYYLFALAAGGWWTIFSPILMTALLVRVSGVALLEKTLKDTKPGYKEYIESTNSFIPWLPKRQ